MLNSTNTINVEEMPTFFNTQEDPLFSAKKASVYIGRTAGTLAVWRCTLEHDLKPVKIRGRIYYYKSELDSFLMADLLP